MTFPPCLWPRTPAVSASAPTTSGSPSVAVVFMGGTALVRGPGQPHVKLKASRTLHSIHARFSVCLQCVQAALPTPAATMVNVMMVTLVTAPVFVTVGSVALPVISAFRAISDPTVKVQ